MDGGARTESPLSQRVLALTRPWPSVTVQLADCGYGVALAVTGCQVAHLHGDQAELLLGDSIARLSRALSESGRVRIDGPSVRLRLEGESDVRLLLSLLSVAIKSCVDDGCIRNDPWCRAGRGVVVG